MRHGFNPLVEKIPWRRKWQPTPVLLPREFHRQRSLAGYSLWGHKQSDTTERLHFLSFLSDFLMVQLSHPYMTTGETIALTMWTSVGNMMLMHFNMLFRFVIAFLPRSEHLLISWLQSLSAVILEPMKRKSVTVSTFPPSICHEVMTLDTMISIFWMLSFKPAIHSLFHSHQESLYFLFTFAIRVISSAYLRLLIFLPATLIPACDSPSLAFLWCVLHIS